MNADLKEGLRLTVIGKSKGCMNGVSELYLDWMIYGKIV